MKTVNLDTIRIAWTKAIRKLCKDPQLLAAELDAGFIIPTGQKRGRRRGYQVFVRVCRWSEEMLRDQHITGGLLHLSRPITRVKKVRKA